MPNNKTNNNCVYYVALEKWVKWLVCLQFNFNLCPQKTGKKVCAYRKVKTKNLILRVSALQALTNNNNFKHSLHSIGTEKLLLLYFSYCRYSSNTQPFHSESVIRIKKIQHKKQRETHTWTRTKITVKKCDVILSMMVSRWFRPPISMYPPVLGRVAYKGGNDVFLILFLF